MHAGIIQGRCGVSERQSQWDKGIYAFKKGYQSRIQLTKHKSDDNMFAHSNSFVDRWKNYF